jgi:tetratricopeptide (TPR) repeat protein
MSVGMGWKMPTLAAVLWIVTLTVWAAVVVGLIKGPPGVLAGAVLTAIATVAAAYVPEIRDSVLRRHAEQSQLEEDAAAAREALGRAGELPEGGPAGLLDPRRGLVDFTGRERELADLISWCEDGRARSARLVTGPGGVGKTRLSVELCVRLRPRGWRLVRAGDQAEMAALSAARRGWSGPILLVVDYAETRIGLREFLRAVVADPGVVRVLLLARSAGEWWDGLRGGEPAVRDLLAEAGEGEPLPVAVAGELSNTELLQAAVPAFAGALGLPVPPRVLVNVGSGAVRMLDLHAAALVAVLQSAMATGKGSVSVTVSVVLDELLGHEERFWHGSARQLGLVGGTGGMRAAILGQVVATGALLGATSQDQAVALLDRVPDAAASVPVASWLRDLYPPETGSSEVGGAQWLGALRPDRLAEHLVVRELTRSPELAERCLRDLDERQALRAITLLGRAAADQREVATPLLQRVLPLLEQVVAGLPGDIELLTAISGGIPYQSAAMAEADLAVTRRILQVLPGDSLGLRARWLTWLGTMLSQTGRWAEALPVTRQAVEIYRNLAGTNPDRYRPDLAMSLSNLSNRFSELGQPAEGLPAEQEAVEIRRALAAVYPDRYRSDLADSLSNLGVRFSELGRPAEALPAAEEAVEIYRELATAYPDRYRPDLADLLSNLGVRFWELGRPAEALAPAEEAVEIYRELAAANPDRYRFYLAGSLANLALWFWALGRPDEALSSIQEAVEIRRELAATYPNRYRPDLANSLSSLGALLSELGRPNERLTQEAVEIYRELAVAYPDRYRPDLGASLTNLGLCFLALGRPAEALPPAEEAVEIYRELVGTDPDRYRPNLAASLSNLGRCFWALDQAAEALPPTAEAVESYQGLVGANPDRYRADLASALSNLGIRFIALGRPAEALPAEQEAVGIRRELAAANPDRYRPDLAASLTNLGLCFLALGRPAEALSPAREAVEIDRESVNANPDRYEADLARSLRLLAFVLEGMGRGAEAETVRRDADRND